jgi:hypothetical protein
MEFFHEVTGDVLKPVRQIEKSRLVILNNVSNVGTWNTQLGALLSAADAAPETQYKQWFTDTFYEDTRSGEQVPFSLGFVQFVPFKAVPGASVCNLIGYQDTAAEDDTRSPIRYYAIAKGLTEVFQRLAESVAAGKPVEVVVSPQFAAGGSWNWVALLLKELAAETGVHTSVYKPE